MMKTATKIYADFNNADSEGRVRLNTQGACKDLENMKIKLEAGMVVSLGDDEGLVTSGLVQFSEEEKIWVAKINWDDLK